MSRRRQPNVPGGREKFCEVWVSPEQAAVLLQAAQATGPEGVGKARYVAEAALAVATAGDAATVETTSQRHAQLAELFALRHEVATAALEVKRVGNNVNQVAKGVHIGQPVPVEEMRGYLVDEREFLGRCRGAVDRIDDLINSITGQGVQA